MSYLGLKDSSHKLIINYVISFIISLYLILHTCIKHLMEQRLKFRNKQTPLNAWDRSSEPSQWTTEEWRCDPGCEEHPRTTRRNLLEGESVVAAEGSTPHRMIATWHSWWRSWRTEETTVRHWDWFLFSSECLGLMHRGQHSAHEFAGAGHLGLGD